MACGKQQVGINTAHVISKLSLQTGDVFSDIALPASLKKKFLVIATLYKETHHHSVI